MSNLIYAKVGDNSPHAGSIGWVNFDGISVRPGAAAQRMNVTAKDGTTFSFDVRSVTVTGTGNPFVGTLAPTFQWAPFGSMGYRIPYPVVLYNTVNITGTLRVTFDNIQARDRNGNAVSTFSVIVADGESTNQQEKIQWTTNGSSWTMLINLPPGYGTSSTPQVTGIGTTTALETGVSGGAAYAPVFATGSPTRVISDITTTAGKQGIAIGFLVTSITLFKDIVKRVDPADQFSMTISSTQTRQVTTTGSMDGVQAEVVQVHPTAGDTFMINESLANNRLYGLDDYRKNITAINLAEGGSSPPLGTLPINGIIAWGDMIQYTVQNRPDMADVWVEKSTPYKSRNAGELMTYVVVVGNAGPDTAENVRLLDVLDADMTEWVYLKTGENMWNTWTGSLEINTIPAGQKIVYYLRGLIKSSSRLTELTNTATISTINYDPDLSNNTSTITSSIIRSANITITKVADKVEVTRDSWLTYTLEIRNLGPSDINDILVTDVISNEMTEVQYSLDDGTTWSSWNGNYTIGELKYGETMQIIIKGYIGF